MWNCPNCNNRTDNEFNVCWTCRAPRGGVPPEQELLLRVIISTTPTLQTHQITEYLGPVFGETILGTNVVRDMFAAITDTFGGRSESYEEILNRGRAVAVREMAGQAEQRGGNGVVGVSVTYETVGESMLMVCATGTAIQAVPHSDLSA